MADTGRSEASGTEGKKWFRVSKTSAIFKVVDSIVKPGTAVRVKSEAIVPQPPVRKMWEVHLYKLVGATRYKVMVEYDDQKYCELKLRNKKKVYELVGVKMGVDYPEEFAGSGGGFDGAGLGGFGGTKDGIMKSLSAFSSSNAVKLGKVKYKAKPKIKAPKKLASGHNLYSAMGTQEIKTREFKAGQSKSNYDASKEENFLTAEMTSKLDSVFDDLVKQIGEYDGGLSGYDQGGAKSLSVAVSKEGNELVALSTSMTREGQQLTLGGEASIYDANGHDPAYHALLKASGYPAHATASLDVQDRGQLVDLLDGASDAAAANVVAPSASSGTSAAP